MQVSWKNVDLTQVRELRALVDEARALPTGDAVMDELAKRPTNLRIHTDAEWTADAATADRAGTFDPETNTMHLPERVLHGSGTGTERREALHTFVHESLHRTQQPARLPRAAYFAEMLGIAPWRRAGLAAVAAAKSAGHGQSPVRGARDAAERDILQVEVEAFDMEQHLAADAARRDGTAVPPQLAQDDIAEWIKPSYTDQIRRNLAATGMVLAAEGAGAAYGVHALRDRSGH
jgi:hypothetical protein